MELPEGILTIYKKQKSTQEEQEEQSPVQTPRTQNLWRKPKRKKSTPTGNPKQLVVADDNDDKKPKKKRMKPENNKLMIGQDPRPISSEDYVKKFETRMTPNHLFQLISEINKPTDLTKEPDATGARQVPLNGNNVLDIKQEDVVAVLDLPRGPKPVEEFKQNDPAITDHVRWCEYERAHPRSFPVIKSWDQQMLDDRIRLQGCNFTDVQTLERLKKPSSAASRDEQPEAESQKEDTQGNPNTQQVYDLATLYEKFYQLIITMSKTVLDIREKEMELRIEPDEQAKQTIKILSDAMVSMSRKMPPPSEAPINLAKFQDIEIDKAQGLEQLSQTNDEPSIAVGKSVPTSKEVVVDEPQTQLQGAQGLDQLSQTNDENSLPVGKSVHTSKEVLVDEQQTQPQEHATNVSTTKKKRSHQDSTGRDSAVTSTYTKRSRSTGTRKRKALKDATIPSFNLCIFSSQEDSYETTQEKNTQEDVTGRVDLDKDVNETIEAEEYPVPSALEETKNPIPSIDEIITRASAPASELLSDIEKLEIIAAVAEQVEKNLEVVEAIPLSIIPPDWNVASTTGHLLMLDKNECTTPPPAISKKAEVLDEGLTKTVEKILNQKPRRRNLTRIHRLPEWFRSPFMLQKKNKKKFIQLIEEKKKMTEEEALLIDFALLQRQEEIVKSGNFLFEFGKIVWADRTAFYSMREGIWIENSIIDAWAVILNKEEAKSDSPSRIFFGVSVFDTISRYNQPGSNKEELEFTFYERLALELEEQGLSVGSLIVAKAIYFPVHYREHYFLYVLLVQEKKVLAFNNLHAKDLLFRFFQSYIACVFPRIELVSAQYTFTKVTLPSHNDKKPNAEDCGIFTMHHMEKYDGGDYDDGTTLDFHTGNIKEYRWIYMLKILMHPSNKNKDKILEAMHQFYTNTAEEEPKEIPDHVDLSSKSYYNDRKIQGWVK
ncbi:OLC1v1005261C1 [Oldenlandia corymbosa var. corymbosa]|uniref:OLC1v1005261C1 n=1 Tax=Oldenlandia corymbosa var. corymbosa TaxID=529605 RepID=A0AAV1DE96_OLDCO|nr:OLC1v1005261C1 [Oldenlandia corymbosa var. corymbosa]